MNKIKSKTDVAKKLVHDRNKYLDFKFKSFLKYKYKIHIQRRILKLEIRVIYR